MVKLSRSNYNYILREYNENGDLLICQLFSQLTDMLEDMDLKKSDLIYLYRNDSKRKSNKHKNLYLRVKKITPIPTCEVHKLDYENYMYKKYHGKSPNE